MNNKTPLTILFVDDEVLALKHFSRAFSKEFTVLTANTAAQAKDILAAHDISILISDERMPQQTGVELLIETKKQWPNIIRLLTTAFSDFDTLSRAINEADIFRFIAKPWSLPDLRHMLHEAADYYVINNAQKQAISDYGDSPKDLGALFAHEFSNPLLSIDLNARMLARYFKSHFTTDSQNALPFSQAFNNKELINTSERIISAVSQMRSLLNTLTYAACDNFKDMHFSHYSMADCVNEMLKHYPFDNHDTEFVNSKLENDFQFYGSKELMIAVLSNLMKNALRAISNIETGRITIKLEVTHEYNKLFFHDTGVGIPATDLPHIFDGSYSTKSIASGLGLTLCKKVLDAFGGTITCTSEERKFTEFIIQIPKQT